LHKKYFLWKYRDNKSIDKILAFVAIKNGEIIGFRGYYPQEYKIDNDVILIASVSDTVVHPSYRRQGVFITLTSFAEKMLDDIYNIKYYLNLTPSWPTIPGYKKLGWKIVNKKYFLSYYCSLSIIINIFKQNKSNINYEISNKLHYYEVLKLIDYKKNKIRINFDKDSLLWRYNNPVRIYKFIYLKDKYENITAFLSLLVMNKNEYIIMDYSYKSISEFNNIINVLNQKLKPKKVTSWSFAIPLKEKKVLMLNGYLPIINIINILNKKKILPYLIKYLNNKLINDIAFYDNSNWYLKSISSDGL